MKTYEVVRALVKMMDEDQPKQKEILWDAFTKMFDLMVAEYEQKKVATVKAKAEPKAKRKPIDWPKAEACRKAGWDFKKIADELGCSYNTVYNHFTKEATK